MVVFMQFKGCVSHVAAYVSADQSGVSIQARLLRLICIIDTQARVFCCFRARCYALLLYVLVPSYVLVPGRIFENIFISVVSLKSFSHLQVKCDVLLLFISILLTYPACIHAIEGFRT